MPAAKRERIFGDRGAFRFQTYHSQREPGVVCGVVDVIEGRHFHVVHRPWPIGSIIQVARIANPHHGGCQSLAAEPCYLNARIIREADPLELRRMLRGRSMRLARGWWFEVLCD